MKNATCFKLSFNPHEQKETITAMLLILHSQRKQ